MPWDTPRRFLVTLCNECEPHSLSCHDKEHAFGKSGADMLVYRLHGLGLTGQHMYDLGEILAGMVAPGPDARLWIREMVDKWSPELLEARKNDHWHWDKRKDDSGEEETQPES
jgi:hypothetical protein